MGRKRSLSHRETALTAARRRIAFFGLCLPIVARVTCRCCSCTQVVWRHDGAHDWPVNTLHNVSEGILASGDDQGMIKVRNSPPSVGLLRILNAWLVEDAIGLKGYVMPALFGCRSDDMLTVFFHVCRVPKLQYM